MSKEQEGVVSIWAYCDEEDPRDANKDVLKEFAGVDSYDPDYQENIIRDTKAPIAELIRELSYFDSFIDGALSAAARVKLEQAFGVLAQYNFAYDPVTARKPIRKDPAFLGTFAWHD